MTSGATAVRLSGIHPPASVDRRGVRFEHDGRILRAFNRPVSDFYRTLLASPAVERAFEAGLVRSWISPIEVEGFDLVVESERIPVVSYPPEWPTAMLREAGLVIARLGLALAPMGITIRDAHPWNILFDGPRGVFVDLGSLVEGDTVSRQWHREFRAHIAVPLALHARGWHTFADAVTAEHRVVRAKALLERTMFRRAFPFSFWRLGRGSRRAADYFGRLVDYLDARPARPTPTKWSKYVQVPNARIGEPATYDAKDAVTDGFLASLPAGTVLDVGANAGWFSELAVHHGHRPVAFDTDDVTISALYDRARAGNLPILSLRMDAMWPTPAHGLALIYEAAPDRIRSDASLWLAVVHHLARDGYSFESIASMVNAFTRDAALVEFIPGDDTHVRSWPLANQPWYTQERFIEAMRPHFPSVEILPSSPAPRMLLIFRRA